jgi:hypothetical protein
MRSLVIACGLLLGVGAVHVDIESDGDVDLEKSWEAQAKYIQELLVKTFDIQTKLFNEVDKNGSNDLSLEELKAKMPAESAELFLKIADSNEDGYLNREEFTNWGANHKIAFVQGASKSKGIFDFGKYKADAEKILGDGTTSDSDLWRTEGMKGHMCDKKFWNAAAKEWSNRYPKSAEHNQRHRYKSWTKDRFNGNYLQLFLPRSISLIGANPLDTCANILPLQKVAELGMSPDFFNWLGCYLKEAPKVYGDDFAGATGLVDPKTRASAVKVATFYKQYHAGTKHDC